MVRLAARQHGVVSAEQAVAHGLDRFAIARRLDAGRWRELHPGVLLPGAGDPPPLGRLHAAALAYGDGARLTARGAAPPVRDPVVSPARALLDFAPTAVGADLEHAVAEAHFRRLAREDELRAVLERHPRRQGTWALRAAGLPEPETNAFVAGWPADLLWRDQRVIVEVDGYDGHSGRRAFKRDRRRDGAQIAAGYVVLRVDADDVHDRPELVVALGAQALARAAA